MARTRQQGDTATRILDVAEKLVQRRGYNGFSYADVATELKVTTASLHYHFATKAALGQALVGRYSARFLDALAAIDLRLPEASARLDAYSDLYGAVLKEKRLCLCGMLAAEYQTLPKPMRQAVVEFFDGNERWLAQALELGREQGTLRFSGSAEEAARMIIAGLEGAMLVARPYGDVGRFETAASQLIASLTDKSPAG
ncbi:MAG TPA: TetR/AcrR family transcriptional regulator [Dehalococcoidia bacterium]|nr:TetR/AcrR family transcriptional regulator [Dehalococcoidia bacterium]